ncbi:MAG: hypothetical protein ACKOW9_01240 [Candidatus Paceibacterota bacterium]
MKFNIEKFNFPPGSREKKERKAALRYLTGRLTLTALAMMLNVTEAEAKSIAANYAPSGEGKTIDYTPTEQVEAYNPFAATVKEENVEEEKGEELEGGGDDPTFGEGNPITLASAYFKTGTVEYKSSEAREQAKHAIHVYLTQVDLFGGGLENSTIFVKGQSSAERPTDMNDELARLRTEEGLKLVREVLDTYFAGKNVNIQKVVESNASVYDGMNADERAKIDSIAQSSPEEFAKMVDAKQSIVVEAVTKVEPPNFETPDDYSNVSVIFGDISGTMKDNMGQVELLADKVNETRELGDVIKIINIEGGNNEQHLQTILHYLESEDGQNSTGDLFLITDEGVNQGKAEGEQAYNERYNAEVSNILRLAGDRKIVVKFLDPKHNSFRYKIFNLNDKPDGLKRQARPNGVTSEDSGFTEEKLNADLFKRIERYQDAGDKPVKEEVNGDQNFHNIAKGRKN